MLLFTTQLLCWVLRDCCSCDDVCSKRGQLEPSRLPFLLLSHTRHVLRRVVQDVSSLCLCGRARARVRTMRACPSARLHVFAFEPVLVRACAKVSPCACASVDAIAPASAAVCESALDMLAAWFVSCGVAGRECPVTMTIKKDASSVRVSVEVFPLSVPSPHPRPQTRTRTTESSDKDRRIQDSEGTPGGFNDTNSSLVLRFVRSRKETRANSSFGSSRHLTS